MLEVTMHEEGDDNPIFRITYNKSCYETCVRMLCLCCLVCSRRIEIKDVNPKSNKGTAYVKMTRNCSTCCKALICGCCAYEWNRIEVDEQCA